MSLPFHPGEALAGGALIGLSAGMLLLSIGRVAGCSGIAARLLGRPDGDSGWRAAFVLGLLLGPVLLELATGRSVTMQISASVPVLIGAGLLVGFGTRLGSGCTSGHGVSGLARLSKRSFAAVSTFMVTAFLTVFVVRHLLGAAS
ncbi:YeeE/YedE family protein [Lichenicoccus roseus]|uniref:YeeE/YedE family protein n=1 Tax=Lichenicoccus roseus TaxID=2683649 RepID=A0A5R9J085_9PROT|nr:YeeE/YedE thiosulfate transporter family protein [Lichenicoccus roseus]TLU71084.1 YeeE/YedE family protein [Lichenicoccus roseus]